MTRRSAEQAKFDEAYDGQPPWDIERAQKALVAVSDRVDGTILDVGCGTGENAMFFAQRGHVVVGIDFVDEPVTRAKAKAAARRIDVQFLVLDALDLGKLSRQFDNVIDCGLFHVFSDEHRTKYVESLTHALVPGGWLWMMCFSDKEPSGQGPRRISMQDIHNAFADGWDVVSIDDTHFETSRHLKDSPFSEDGPCAYLVVLKRTLAKKNQDNDMISKPDSDLLH